MSAPGFRGLSVGALFIPESELSEQFIRASGPGGQNVNKVSSAVQLSFDVAHSPSLPHRVRERLMALAGSRLDKAGVLTIAAQQHRQQDRNRADARARLAELIAQAITPPKPRYKTRVPKSSKRKRLDSKKHRGAAKQSRARPVSD